MNAATSFGHFDIDSGQREPEAMPQAWDSDEPEQGVAGVCRAPLQQGYDPVAEGHRNRDHEQEEEQRERRSFERTSPVAQDKSGDPDENDEECNYGQLVRAVDVRNRPLEAVPEYHRDQKERDSDQGTKARSPKDPFPLQENEQRAEEGN